MALVLRATSVDEYQHFDLYFSGSRSGHFDLDFKVPMRLGQLRSLVFPVLRAQMVLDGVDLYCQQPKLPFK